MRDDRFAEFAAAGEDARELARRIALLRRIETKTVDPRQMRLGLGQRGEGIFFTEMAQEAENQPAADAPARLTLAQAFFQAIEHGEKGNAARRVRLRIEEHLGMDHVVGCGALEIGQHQVAKIVGRAQHVGTGVVEIEEGLQAVEIVGGSERRFIGVRQRDAVAAGQREGQRRLQRAFDMHMQLGLGHAAGQFEAGVLVLRGDHGNSPESLAGDQHQAWPEPWILQNTCDTGRQKRPANKKRDPQAAFPGTGGAYFGIEPSTPST